jgi:hypothetical protein
LLGSRLDRISQEYQALQSSNVKKIGTRCSEKAFIKWAAFLCDRIPYYRDKLGSQLSGGLQAANGPVGSPGNAIAIKKAIDGAANTLDQLLLIEKEIRSIKIPPRFEPLRHAFEGITVGCLEASQRYRDDLRSIALDARSPSPQSTYCLTLSFGPIPNVEAISEELRKLKRKTSDNTLLTHSSELPSNRSFSENLRILFGEPPPPAPTRTRKRTTRAGVRNTVSLINKIRRIF